MICASLTRHLLPRVSEIKGMNPEKICVFENNFIKVFDKFVLKKRTCDERAWVRFLYLKKQFHHDNVGTCKIYIFFPKLWHTSYRKHF